MAEQSSTKLSLSLSAKSEDESAEQQKQEEVITMSAKADAGAEDGGAEDSGEGNGDDDDEDEEDMVDPMDTLRDNCREQRNCDAMVQKLDACTARVESRSKNREECVEELLDLVHCVDDCVSKQIHHHWK